ncbi:MAG: formylglycine-generating enzyme family protein [Gammaproteobacteria bacterium]
MLKTEVTISDEDRSKRKRYFAATIITCVAFLALGIAIHLIGMLDKGMATMKSKATYDLAEMDLHIRAAGEDVFLHQKHEAGKLEHEKYALSEVSELISPVQWKELDSMITIPEGEFKMGTNHRLADPQNRPEHVVTLPAYQISKYPVTNVQYAKFVANNDYRPPSSWRNGKINQSELLHPVTLVSWYDGNNYCESIGGRLPTEAEWEKAARGTDGRRWPWGNKMDAKRLNTYYNMGSTTDVTMFPAGVSPYGVMDMAGNVSEWTQDSFYKYEGSDASDDIFKGKIGAVTNPQDKALKVVDLIEVNAEYKVLRGGSWKSDPFSTSSYHRNFSFPHYASDFYGFRCAKDVAAGKENTR